MNLIQPIEPVAPPVRSAGVTGAAIVLFLQGAILGVAGAVAAVVTLGMTLDLLVGIVWALIRTVGIDAATPGLFPDLAIANLDTYLLLAVVATCLLLLSRKQITLGQALLAGDPEAVPSAVGLQWWFLGVGALFAFWTLVVTKDAVLFPVVAIVLPLVALALFAVGGQRPFPSASGSGGSSFGSGDSVSLRIWRGTRNPLPATTVPTPVRRPGELTAAAVILFVLGAGTGGSALFVIVLFVALLLGSGSVAATVLTLAVGLLLLALAAIEIWTGVRLLRDPRAALDAAGIIALALLLLAAVSLVLGVLNALVGQAGYGAVALAIVTGLLSASLPTALVILLVRGDEKLPVGRSASFLRRSTTKEGVLALAFLTPAFIVFYGFFFYPLGRLVHFALYQQNRTGTAERYVGPSQLTDVLSGDEFREGLLHTLTYVLFTVPAGLVLGIVLAVVANRRLKGIKFFQTVLSSTVATSVAVASVIFFVLLNPQVGYFKVSWLAEPSQVLFGVSLSSVWQNLGLTFIIVLAGLQAVPDELVESATLDGAGPVRRFFSVTLPIISPTLLFLIVVLTVFAFQAFAQIDILTAGGPAGASETLVFKIFQLQQPIDLGEGSAMALGLFGITFIVTMGQFLILDRRVHYGS